MRFDEVSPPIDEMTNHYNIIEQIRTATPNRREITSVINGFKQSKPTGFDDFPAEIFFAPLDMLLSLIWKSWESDF